MVESVKIRTPSHYNSDKYNNPLVRGLEKAERFNFETCVICCRGVRGKRSGIIGGKKKYRYLN